MEETNNLLKNSGFKKGIPNDWQTFATGNTHTFSYPEMGRAGSSVAIDFQIREEGKTAAWIQTVLIDSAKKYKLSGYMKTLNITGTGASIRIDWKDKNGKYISSASIMARQKGTISWSFFEGVVTPNQNAIKATIILDMFDSSGKVWFDDISFILLDDSDNPKMFIDINEINAIKIKIDANQEPWRTAYNKLMNKEIDKNYGSIGWAIQLPIQSVTYGGPIPPSGNRHDYYSYDSENKNYTRYDYFAALNVGKAVRSLGLAYVFTGDIRYADKGIQLIKGWCIDPSTKMNPKYTNTYSKIESGLTFPGMFYGAGLIWNYSGWNSADKTIFKSWVSSLIADAKKENWCFGTACTNWENWRLTLIAAGSSLLNDDPGLNYPFNRWKELIPSQIDLQGRMVHELNRGNQSLFYSTFAINAMTQTAEIARHHGVDLYNYKLSDGRGLEKALDYHAPYIVNPGSWPNNPGIVQIRATENAAIYELAYSYKQKPSYQQVINVVGRPMYEIRNMGPTTLTHAYRG